MPTMISLERAGLARRRSQVFQPCSRKKLKPTEPTRKKEKMGVPYGYFFAPNPTLGQMTGGLNTIYIRMK